MPYLPDITGFTYVESLPQGLFSGYTIPCEECGSLRTVYCTHDLGDQYVWSWFCCDCGALSGKLLDATHTEDDTITDSLIQLLSEE